MRAPASARSLAFNEIVGKWIPGFCQGRDHAFAVGGALR
jgi:hypothetical protein